MNQSQSELAKQYFHHRNDCRLCLSENVVKAIPFKPTPIAEKYSDSQQKDTCPLFPVDLYICQDCGHVQILDVIAPEYLWADYTYHSGQTQGIIDHFKDVSELILDKYGPLPKPFVLDVGSNDGTFLKCFKEKGFKVLGIDPASDIAAQATRNGIETIADLMTAENGQKIVAQHGQASLVTAFNVFAHADEMRDLLKGIATTLAADGLFVFEVSYLKDIIDKMLIGTIFHEHLCNHSLKPMINFLAAEGLEVIHVEHVSIQGGSIIGFAQHKSGPRPTQPSVAEMVKQEDASDLHSMTTMNAFVARFDTMKEQAKALIAKHQPGIIAAYGAARSGPMLLTQYDIGADITEIYDDHAQKVGRYSPGDSILVEPTEKLMDTMPKLTVILAWIHAKAIVRKHLDYLEQGGAFLTLTPQVVLITKENYADFIR
ncbi:methyltransferase domain-containing protein [Pseudoalteromonas rubra]|uniref:Methyltransferase domain-containing protein n=1 Tax=Pseudoalteromonas rubra TaxID=43658 RepID=A0A5S3UX90_9GAMM|nr:class I SAM-dependent methyltransferase [Pseudoalteromonas rubra]QPB82638.1 methyltransferase domain-containing protein [Pseudoalteromonas rubra]